MKMFFCVLFVHFYPVFACKMPAAGVPFTHSKNRNKQNPATNISSISHFEAIL